MRGWHRMDRWWREVTEQGPEGKASAIVSIAFVAAHVCIGLLCAFAPLSIASSDVVANYAALVATIVPSIDAFVLISSFPSHTQLTLAVLWTCVPISTFMVARIPWFWIADMTRLRRSPWALVVLTLTLGLIGVMLMQLDVDASTLSGRGRGARLFAGMSNVRVLLGVMGGLMCAGVALCFGYLCRVLGLAREVLKDDFR